MAHLLSDHNCERQAKQIMRQLQLMTISNLRRVINDTAYARACAESITQILLNAELYIGVPRLYIP